MAHEKRALITGITGQDGWYLAEFLLGKNYEVFGFVRSRSTDLYERIDHLTDRITLLEGDMLDSGSLMRTNKVAFGSGLAISVRMVLTRLIELAGVRRLRLDDAACGSAETPAIRARSTAAEAL